MKKNSSKTETPNVENANVETTTVETTTATENVGNDLESANQAPLRKSSKNEKANDFSDIEFLQKENPLDYVSNEVSSSKFDEVREKEIQKTLPILAALALNGIVLNPLLILLGKWWEVKPARSAIKDMIDAEAEAKGHDAAIYLQTILGEQVELFSNLQNAINRVRYAKTYFKPRTPLTNKIITKPINIDNVVYLVPVALFEQAKIDHANDREALKAAVIAFSTVRTDEIEAL